MSSSDFQLCCGLGQFFLVGQRYGYNRMIMHIFNSKKAAIEQHYQHVFSTSPRPLDDSILLQPGSHPLEVPLEELVSPFVPGVFTTNIRVIGARPNRAGARLA